MKRIFCLIVTTISIVSVFSQQDTTYNRITSYVGTPSTTLNHIETTFRIGQRQYVLLTIADGQSQYFTVVEIDEFGNEIKSISLLHDLGSMFICPGNSVLVDRDSNIVLAASVLLDSLEPADGYLAKLSPELDTFWTKTYTIPATIAGCPADTFAGNYFNTIKETLDGSYIVGGKYRLNCQPGTVNDRACLLKVDSVGNINWWRVYPGYYSYYDIATTIDSGFVFLTRIIHGLKLTKVNKAGLVEWQEDLNGLNTHKRGQDIEFINDSILAIAAQYIYDEVPTISTNGIDFFLFDIHNRSLLVDKYYKLFLNIQCVTLHQNIRMQTLKDGYIITGTAWVLNSDSTEAGTKGIMMKLNTNGDSVWTRYYTYGDFEDEHQFNDFLIMDDGGFLVTGFYFPWTANYSAWLVRTDSNGYAPGAYPTGIFKPEPIVSELSIYPNPTSDVSWLDLKVIQAMNRGGNIRLYGMQGNLIQEQKIFLGDQSHKIDVKALKAGLYLVSVLLEDGKAFQSKLVVQ